MCALLPHTKGKAIPVHTSVSGGLFEPIISFVISFETPEKETKPKLTPWAQEAYAQKSVFILQNMDMYLQTLKPDVWSAFGAVLGVTSWEKLVLVAPQDPSVVVQREWSPGSQAGPELAVQKMTKKNFTP